MLQLIDIRHSSTFVWLQYGEANFEKKYTSKEHKYLGKSSQTVSCCMCRIYFGTPCCNCQKSTRRTSFSERSLLFSSVTQSVYNCSHLWALNIAQQTFPWQFYFTVMHEGTQISTTNFRPLYIHFLFYLTFRVKKCYTKSL